MTQYDQPLAAPLIGLTPPTPRRLALELLLDLLIIAVAVVVISFGLVGALLGVRAVQQGLSPADIAALGQDGMLRLLGVDGVLLALVAQNAVFVGVPLVRSRLRGEPVAAIGLQARQPLRLALLGLGLGALLLVANALLGALFVSLGVRQNQVEQYPLFAGDYLGQAMFMLGAALVVPIGEEVLFRGYLFHTLRRIGAGTAWGLPVAYAVSAAAFGVAHALAATQGVAALVVPTIVMGLALAWAVQRTGSLLPSIVAHSLNNGVALLALVTCVNNPGMCPGV
jgi:membrane protease YdiL (CAAX protease family)